MESGGGGSLVPRPRFPTAAAGLHHRYVKVGLDDALVPSDWDGCVYT